MRPVRRMMVRIGILVVAVAVLVLFACGGGESDSDDARTATTASSRGCTPARATAAGSDWAYPNYDAAGSRATFTSSISAANVTELAEAWRYELPSGGAFGAAATTPVIIGGVIYLGDLFTNVHAIDLASGGRRWFEDVGVNVFGPSGVAVHGGCVYANRAGKEIAAYDAASGQRIWTTNILAAGGQVNIQPTVADGVVLAATSSLAQPGARGTLFGLDAASGEILWSFDTIESEDLWGHPEINSGGGSWQTPSIDLEAEVTYWGISNAYPYPGVPGFPNGTSRPGDNRWTASILALDTASGELRWGHQAVPHDLFDRDMILAGVATLAGGRKVVISAGKAARVIGLDPDGTVLWDTPVGKHQNDGVESFEGKLEVLPGISGGVVTPLAIAEGVVFVSVVNAPVTYAGPEDSSGGAVRLGTFPSQLVAIDAASGRIVWDVELPGDGFGGATVVNDLVFTSVITGQVLAFDRATGAQVWSYRAPGGINGSPAFVDDMLVIPVGFGDPPVLLALQLSR